MAPFFVRTEKEPWPRCVVTVQMSMNFSVPFLDSNWSL